MIYKVVLDKTEYLTLKRPEDYDFFKDESHLVSVNYDRKLGIFTNTYKRRKRTIRHFSNYEKAKHHADRLAGMFTRVKGNRIYSIQYSKFYSAVDVFIIKDLQKYEMTNWVGI
jgi:hypothetical protein